MFGKFTVRVTRNGKCEPDLTELRRVGLPEDRSHGFTVAVWKLQRTLRLQKKIPFSHLQLVNLAVGQAVLTKGRNSQAFR